MNWYHLWSCADISPKKKLVKFVIFGIFIVIYGFSFCYKLDVNFKTIQMSHICLHDERWAQNQRKYGNFDIVNELSSSGCVTLVVPLCFWSRKNVCQIIMHYFGFTLHLFESSLNYSIVVKIITKVCSCTKNAQSKNEVLCGEIRSWKLVLHEENFAPFG